MRALIALIALAACTPKPAACPVMPVVQQGPAFLWKVPKAEGPTLGLYGTVHDIALAGVPAPPLAALDGSAVFASELGDAQPDPEKLHALTTYRSGAGIDTQLP